MVSMDTVVLAVFLVLPVVALYLISLATFLKALERQENVVWQRLGKPALGMDHGTPDDFRDQWRAIRFLIRREYATLASPDVRKAGQRARTWFMVAGSMIVVVFALTLIFFLGVGA